MTKRIIVLLTLLCLYVLCTQALAAEEHPWAPGEVMIKFQDNMERSNIDIFIADYQQYQLHYLWGGFNNKPPYEMHFCFNNNIIEDTEFLEIIRADERVYAAGFNYDWDPAHVVVRLVSYSGMLSFINGYVNTFGIKHMVEKLTSIFFYLPNDTPEQFDLIDIFKNDPRVLTVGTFARQLPGKITITPNYPFNLLEFLSDYADYDLNQIGNSNSEFSFNYSKISIPDFVELLLNDERVESATPCYIGIFSDRYVWAPGEVMIKFQDDMERSDIEIFIADYEQYQLRFLEGGYGSSPPYEMQLCFNNSIIEDTEFLEIIRTDERVYAAGFNYDWDTWYVVVRLAQVSMYHNFLPDYYQYGLRLQTFDSTTFIFLWTYDTIDQFDLIELIKTDTRVVAAGTFARQVPGEISMSFISPYNLQQFLSDYAEYDVIHRFSAYSMEGFYFNYSKISMPAFIELLSYNVGIQWPTANYIGILEPIEPPIVHIDNDILPIKTFNICSYPNPITHGEVTIKWNTIQTRQHENMEIAIYNIRGQLVHKTNEFQTKNGENSFVWNGRNQNNQDVANGVYFYQLQTTEKNYTGKFLMLKNKE